MQSPVVAPRGKSLPWRIGSENVLTPWLQSYLGKDRKYG
jgi:hypothetical protein